MMMKSMISSKKKLKIFSFLEQKTKAIPNKSMKNIKITNILIKNAAKILGK